MRNRLILLLLFVFMIISITEAQDKHEELNVDNFSWLIGKWEADFGEFKYYEEWLKEGGNWFSGNGYRIKEGERFDGEKLVLTNIHGYISYIAVVGKQVPILFALVEQSNNKYVFENKEHDFPQRIIYEYVTNDSLKVVVEGEVKGDLIKDNYNLVRIQ